MDPYKTITKGKLTLNIHHDSDPMNPREDDEGLTTEMLCIHRNYNIGEKHNFSTLEEIADSIRPQDIALLIYIYEHSGITISTDPFSCQWDSGQIGYIIQRSNNPLNSVKFISGQEEESRDEIEKRLKAEVELYDHFVTGQVFGFELLENDVETDSCWGFYGDDWKENGMIDHLPKEFKDVT